ncbi:hypothetical protein ANCCAN_25967 [Ancylostoma caninum]|uniref:Uncharacterized protein n=1 Tax=Ancylostoma caninum TaxID=29170 RepID=A0A368FBK5_ANCCA|nr:hypothetical protein ANCCAN_25967 [Ancylostoma caninum]
MAMLYADYVTMQLIYMLLTWSNLGEWNRRGSSRWLMIRMVCTVECLLPKIQTSCT